MAWRERQALPPVDCATRRQWVRILYDAAVASGAPPQRALAAARGAERRAHETRGSESPIGVDAWVAWKYSDTVLIGSEAPDAHETLALHAYTEVLTRMHQIVSTPCPQLTVALTDEESAASLAWLDVPSHALADAGGHARWQREYDAVQQGHSDLLSGVKRAAAPAAGAATLRKCRGCGSANVDQEHVQRRAGDEPMTEVVRCNDCGRRTDYD